MILPKVVDTSVHLLYNILRYSFFRSAYTVIMMKAMGGCIVAVQLIRTIQIVHPFESASEAEFLKEFFRFLGCLVYDRPSPEAWNVESLSQSDAVIFLNYPMESQYGFSSGSICVYLSFDFSAQNSEVYVWKTLEGQI